jgi:hypothetical protein
MQPGPRAPRPGAPMAPRPGQTVPPEQQGPAPGQNEKPEERITRQSGAQGASFSDDTAGVIWQLAIWAVNPADGDDALAARRAQVRQLLLSMVDQLAPE